MRRAPADKDFNGWVSQLAASRRRQQAKQHLLQAGPPALPAIRQGLRHADAMVRRTCVNLLDHLVDEASIPDLVGALDDEDTEVSRRALHALACDRCKENACRPGDDIWVPRALEFVRGHANPDIRAAAIDALGRLVATRPDVAAALLDAAESDHNPGVRNIARRRTRRLHHLDA